MPVAANVLARCAALALIVGHAPAATVDVDYQQLRELPIGASLLTELKIDIPSGPREYARDLARLRLDWDGSKSPLLIALRGLPVPAMREALVAASAQVLPTPHGEALSLPRDPRYHLLPLADDEAAMGTANGLAAYAARPWPEPTGAMIAFHGAPRDFNLEEFADRVSELTITLTRESNLVGRIACPDRKAAKGLMSYISNRLPLLDAAAALGVDKAQFPKRMVDAAVIERHGDVIDITVDLSGSDALRQEAHEFLIKTLRRRMKKAL